MNGVAGWLQRAMGRSRQRNGAAELTAMELQRWLSEGRELQILDIRPAGAFHDQHLPGARHLPLDRLAAESAALDRSRATVVY
jgi:rhodanese-related sulfurtransferase